MKKKLAIVILLLSSNSYAGLCMDQFEDCLSELSNLCGGIEGESKAALTVKQLCVLGAQQYCYQSVVTTFGQEQCDKEYQERKDQEEADSTKKYNAEEKTK